MAGKPMPPAEALERFDQIDASAPYEARMQDLSVVKMLVMTIRDLQHRVAVVEGVLYQAAIKDRNIAQGLMYSEEVNRDV